MSDCFFSDSERETFDFAKNMAKAAHPGLVICLTGDLGVGKTVFAKGYAAGLDIQGPITSPTFTLIHEYPHGRLPLYHFDVYRINDEEEMYGLGFEEYFYGDGVCLVEWGGKISGLLPKDTVWVHILKVPEKGENCRKIQTEYIK